VAVLAPTFHLHWLSNVSRLAFRPNQLQILFFLKIFFFILKCVVLSPCVYVPEVSDLPGAGATGSCEPPDVGAET